MITCLYTPLTWPDHVRKFYAEWLDAAGLRAERARDFDRFVLRMEEMIGDYLMDPTLDHVELTRREDDE